MPWLESDQRVGALRRLTTFLVLSTFLVHSFLVLGYEEGAMQVPKERHKGQMKNFLLG